MKKIQLVWPSILYKRPVSKVSSLYNTLASKYNPNKPELNTNMSEEIQKINSKLSESVKNETNKQKFKYLYSNYNNFKKMKVNYPYSKTSRYANNKIKKSRVKNINEIHDNNSLFFIFLTNSK